MVDLTFYKPGTNFVNCRGRPHMGALTMQVEVFPLGSVSENSVLVRAIEWVPADDLSMVKHKPWLEEKIQNFLTANSEAWVPSDLVTIEPCREDCL